MSLDQQGTTHVLPPAATARRGVSIVIPNLNSPLVRRTILAACAQLPEVGGGEVIVVGRDEPRAVPQLEAVRFIDTGIPVIPAVARNRGVAVAVYPWLVFVDADCVPAPGWLAGLCAYLAREVCAVGGAVTFGRGSYWRFSDNLAWFHAYTPGRSPGPRPYLPTISLALHRSSFDLVGGFDETLPTAEDLDFTIRLRRAGVPLYFAPHARVEHLPSRFSFRALWQHSRIAGQHSIRVRMRYPEVFKMPPALTNRWVLGALSPFIAAYTVGSVCSGEPRVLRHWTVLPALYLAKLAWCVGAVETLSQTARGAGVIAPRVLAIVVHWRNPDDTAACLRSLALAAYPALDIAVVDNGSADGAILAELATTLRARLITSVRNRGFAGGANLGLQCALDARYAYALLVNNDAIVAPDMVSRLVVTAEADPMIGAVGPKVLDAAAPWRIWYLGGRWRGWFVESLGEGQRDGPRWDAVWPVDFVSGCGMLLRCAALREVGLFDERFFMYYEDADLCQRLARAGYRIVADGRARMWHRIARSTAHDVALRRFVRERSRSAFYLRTAGRCRWPLMALLLGIAWLRCSVGDLRAGRPDAAWAAARGLWAGWHDARERVTR